MTDGLGQAPPGSARVGSLPPHTMGFDCNERVPLEHGLKFRNAGYRFVVRYVRRDQKHGFDLTVPEVLDIMKAGLALMVVQHVAPEGWQPRALGNGTHTAEFRRRQLEILGSGAAYGSVAAQETAALGIPRGVTLWCDLEGVSNSAPAANVIAFCKNWYAKVKEAGYDPGLYVGYNAGLTADHLYWKLPFARYWGAYNVDVTPAERGYQMKQKPYPSPIKRLPVPFQYDEDEILVDHKGGTPALLLPPR